ncbi:MAG: transposase [Pseudomonadales bacterium]|nr:transposase [Pseudomonadales bacterium]
MTGRHIVSRRRHSAELKARIIAACAEPGASIARIALEHGLNANLVHRWRRLAEGRQPIPVVSTPRDAFVPVTLTPSLADPVIRIVVRRAESTLEIQWPATAARECSQWLGDLLR